MWYCILYHIIKVETQAHIMDIKHESCMVRKNNHRLLCFSMCKYPCLNEYLWVIEKDWLHIHIISISNIMIFNTLKIHAIWIIILACEPWWCYWYVLDANRIFQTDLSLSLAGNAIYSICVIASDFTHFYALFCFCFCFCFCFLCWHDSGILR